MFRASEASKLPTRRACRKFNLKEELQFMAWSINLKEISANDLNLVPDGVYTFSLNAGASYNDKGGINASAQIITDGPYRGRKMLFSYPNPDQFPWAGPSLKKLSVAIGIDVEDGEDPVEYLNRVAGSLFSSKVVNKVDKNGEDRSNLQTMSVKPAILQ
jgi:hypothetical protein